jgi:DNA-binding transcriptional regulator LsrR (DeoR family)
VRQRQLIPLGDDARTVELLTDIATRFYLRGESQIQIAQALGLDPSTVSRHLKRARSEGIVHVEIRPPRRADVDLGLELAARYGLARAIVAPDAADGTDDRLGAVAAEYIEGLLSAGTCLGISWGRTLANVVHHLRPRAVAGLDAAQLAGGVNDPVPGIQGADLVRRVAELYPGTRVHYLHAPAIVGSPATRTALASDPAIESALAAARACEVALVGVGQISPQSTLYRGEHVSPDDWAVLVKAGAIGNMNTRFFDRHGRPVPELDDRTIAIDWDELRAIPNVVAIAGGVDKVAALDGALATGAIDSLVTDEQTARTLLER